MLSLTCPDCSEPFGFSADCEACMAPRLLLGLDEFTNPELSEKWKAAWIAQVKSLTDEELNRLIREVHDLICVRRKS